MSAAALSRLMLFVSQGPRAVRAVRDVDLEQCCVWLDVVSRNRFLKVSQVSSLMSCRRCRLTIRLGPRGSGCPRVVSFVRLTSAIPLSIRLHL